MSSPRFVLDACVLYSSLLRDLLIRIYHHTSVNLHWTDRIQDEWSRNLKANRPDLAPEKIDRTRQLMERGVPKARVSGYELLEASLTLPDPNDRHVLAAAITCRASAIVTFNLSDFPTAALEPFGLTALHPDECVRGLVDSQEAAIVRAARELRSKLAIRLTPWNSC